MKQVLGQEDHYTQILDNTCSTEFLLHILVAEDSTGSQVFRFVTFNNFTVMRSELLDIPQ